MPLFKSTKPQGSLNISAGRSPLPSPVDSPLQSPAFPPSQSAAYSPGGVQYDESTDPSDSQRYYSSDGQQPHPARFASCPQGQIRPSHNYQGRPVVNVAPGQLAGNSQAPLTAISTTNQEEPRQKRLTKRSLFGLHSSKENISNPPPSVLTLGRSTSAQELPAQELPAQESQGGTILQSARTQYPGEGFSSDTHEGKESPNEHIPSQGHTELDEQYYGPQNHLDSPQSHTSSHCSGHCPEEASHHNQQQTAHKPYQLFPSNVSNPYLPYNPQLDRPSLENFDPYQINRPPSQQSLGPPSPILALPQANESRPLASQVRQKSQSPETVMARGEGSDASMRQQMAQQHQQGGEQGYGQYSAPQGSRLFKQHSSTMAEHGRSTPPPTRSREDFNTQDYSALLQRHEELQGKYSKVKKYYFEKDAQVTALQNTVANQRLSMSKTTLDDHEYTTRFNRLDGAINNLSFNIRKEWKGIPPWLAAVVNKDAHTVGTKEMTAVGRACITRWIVEEILDRHFHPRIEPGLSHQLKVIEKNIRRAGQNPLLGEEQREDLVVKLTSWRLTTLEGLADSMAAEQGHEYNQQLTVHLVEKLTDSLQINLNEPPPPGLESGVRGIIELAVSLASTLPQESRDVCVEYYMPGSFINETCMRRESGIPPLTNPGVNIDSSGAPDQMQGDQGSTGSGDNDSLAENEGEKENSGNGGVQPRTESLQTHGGNGQQPQMKKDDNRKKGLFGGRGISSKKPSQPGNSNPSGGLIPSSSTRTISTAAGTGFGGRERESMEKSDRDARIRFAVFVGVEVRGKGKEGGNVLVRAPCYEL